MSDCRCCEGLSAETPVLIDNRPGLKAIAYRAGTHPQFKETLLSRLSTSGIAPLDGLTTRQDDDFAIALLDAWAAVCDVMTFYQERLANEQYFGTATELFSVVQLARLIDYKLQPGVAASTDLAFTIEEAPGALGQALGVGTTAQVVPSQPLRAIVDVGTKAQSIPGPGEEAQTFETVARIEARAEWNALRPRLKRPQPIAVSAGTVFLQGTDTNLKPGDTVLIAASATSRAVRKVLSVRVDDEAKVTRIDFDVPPAPLPPYTHPQNLPEGKVDTLSTKAPLTAALIANEILSKSWSEANLAAVVAIQGWDPQALATNVAKQIAAPPATANAGMFALRQRAAIFGHNAPKWTSLSGNLRFGERITKPDGTFLGVPAAFGVDWEGRKLSDDLGGKNFVFLDNVYPAITKDSWVALESPSAADESVTLTLVGQVKSHVEMTRSDFAISAKVSRLTVLPAAGSSTTFAEFRMRTTAVLGQSERLVPADLPIPNLVKGDVVVLDRLHLGLTPGQRVILTGERDDLRGAVNSEALTLKAVTIDGGFTVLKFQKALFYQYVGATVTINANVAPATHGESVGEAVGSGNGSQAFQQFTLRQPPLTHVSASVPSGALSTLELRVNDLLWREVPTLFGHGPDERIYATRTDDQSRTTVMFGDGRTGARLPTGQENVRAGYRKGLGEGGNLGPDRLTQMLTRPLGVKGVTNPLPAAGGADREQLADARRTAPLTALTLGRIVSLADYQDFARAFAGIGKALATWTWNGNTRGVFITVAGPRGAPVETGSTLRANLLKAILAAGDPTVPFSVDTYTPRFFRLAAALQIDPDYLPKKVVAAVTSSLRQRFSFDAREFGQPVTRSEIVTIIQHVPGIVAVDLNELYRTDKAPGLSDVLEAAAPQPGTTTVFGAELLTLDAGPVQLDVLP